MRHLALHIRRREQMSHTTAARRLRRLVLPTLLVVLPACSRNQANTDVASGEATVVEFNNESLAQADVFVRAQGSDSRRIGTVLAGRKEDLVVPREIAIRGSITVFARLLARSGVPSSGPVAVAPGAHLSVRLPVDERTLIVLPGQS
jgi:hypothetical protein